MGMRIMKWIGWPIFILFVAFLIGLFIYDKTMVEGELKAQDANLSQATMIGHEQHAGFSSVEIHFEKTINKDDTLNIEYPVFTDEEANKRFQHWIEQQKSNGASDIFVKTERIDDYFYHFYIYAKQAKSEAFLPFMVSTKEESVVALTDLFAVDDNFIEKLQELTFERLEQEIDSDIIIETFAQIDDMRWLVDEEVLTLYLPEEAEDSSVAYTSVDLPLAKLRPFAKAEFIQQNDLLASIVAEEQAQKEKERKRKEEEQKQQEKDQTEGQIGKYIAFTFDDGPHPEVTPDVLNVLKDFNAKATFFMIGHEINKYPEIVRQVAEEGHELANHSHNHPNLTEMSPQAIQEQIIGPKEMISQITGIEPTLFRPPYGAVDEKVMSVIGNLGNSAILWSVDSRDWEVKHVNTIYQNVMRDAKGGSIVLMHDLYPTTTETLKRLLTSLSDQGYEFITVSDLLNKLNTGGAGPHRGV